MKKHRGLKRYYKSLSTKVDDLSGLNFTDPTKAWFELWHIHFDWKGYGNNSFKKRKPHLDKLFRHFTLLEEKAQLLKTDYQIWATLLDYDSSSDALFLHTTNPNHDNFPWKIKDLTQTNTLTNEQLSEYVQGLSGYKILFGKADESYCVIYKDNVGLSLI
ncbi:MAG TPA: hypothetical protein VGF30_01730 [Bacteroidia bacterium]